MEDARGGSRPRRRVFSEPGTFNRFFHGERCKQTKHAISIIARTKIKRNSPILRPRPDSGSRWYIGTTTSTSRWTARRPARSRCDGSSADPWLAFCETAGNPSSASSRSRTVAAEASAERDLSDFFGPPPFPTGTDRSAAAAVHPAVRASPTRVASCREAVTAVIIFSRFTIATEIADPIF